MKQISKKTQGGIFMQEFTQQKMERFVNELTRISRSNPPINPAHLPSHEERARNAKIYLQELVDFTTYWPNGFPVYRLRKNLFEKRINSGLYSYQDGDTHFKLYMSETAPRHYILYLHPISKLEDTDFFKRDNP